MSLVAENLGFSYVAGHPVLSGVSLSVEPGERVALVAPSGTGKTTLCRLLGGYLEPREGRVLVDGAPLGRAARAARPVQLIWQHPEQAFDPRVRLWRSLAEGLRETDEADAAAGFSRRAGAHGVCRTDQVCERLRASGLMERLGVREAWLTRLPHELSGGELMRLAITRALLVRPRYLICDEMTAMLDALTQAQVWAGVLDLAQEREMGLVVVSHSPALLRRVATRQVRI